jgi:Domain of unknown function (DUF4397)
MGKRVSPVVALAFALAALLGFSGTAAGQEAEGTVTIVHGFRGLVADVYLDGTLILESFEPERATDPVQLAAGDHEVEVREAGAEASSAAAVAGTLNVPAGSNLSAVVHLSESGEPTMTVFDNDTRTVPPGSSRLVVRHAAAAGPVNVSVDDAPLASDLANPREAGREVTATTHRVSVSAGSEVLLPPQDVPLQEGTAQYLYLIGSQDDGTVAWITQTVSGLQTVPAGVPTGNSGLADAGSGGGAPVLPLVAAAFFVLMGGLGVREAVRAR